MVDNLMASYDLSDELSHAALAMIRNGRRFSDKIMREVRRRPMKVAIVNLGQIVSGDWRNPFAAGDTILSDGERIVSVGTASAQAVEAPTS